MTRARAHHHRTRRRDALRNIIAHVAQIKPKSRQRRLGATGRSSRRRSCPDSGTVTDGRWCPRRSSSRWWSRRTSNSIATLHEAEPPKTARASVASDRPAPAGDEASQLLLGVGHPPTPTPSSCPRGRDPRAQPGRRPRRRGATSPRRTARTGRAASRAWHRDDPGTKSDTSAAVCDRKMEASNRVTAPLPIARRAARPTTLRDQVRSA